MADQLATLADLAAQLDVPDGDLHTAAATLAIEAATAVVQAAAGGQRIIQIAADTAVFDLDQNDDSPYLDLPQVPVSAVTSVQVGSATVLDFSPQLTRGRLWRATGWRSAAQPFYPAPSQVTVVYTHGLAAGDQRIQLARAATLQLASELYKAPGAGVVREQIDDYAVQYSTAATALDTTMATALRRAYGRRQRTVRLVAGR